MFSKKQSRLQLQLAYKETLSLNLQERLRVAEERGDLELVAHLEREATYLGLWT